MSNKYIDYNDELITKYFKDLNRESLITIDEEVELAKRIVEGDQDAVDKLVKANLKFVVTIAKEYQGQGVPLPDLINEGNYGIIKAAHRFDHTKGFRFISYAVHWIRQSVIQSLNDNARTIRLPVNVIFKLTKELSDIDSAIKGYGHSNYESEGTSVPSVVSYNTVISDDGDELSEFLHSDDSASKLVDDWERSDMINNGLALSMVCLDTREQDVIKLYYGVDSDYPPMTLESIGDMYDLTKERVRQIKERAIKKIKHQIIVTGNTELESYI